MTTALLAGCIGGDDDGEELNEMGLPDVDPVTGLVEETLEWSGSTSQGVFVCDNPLGECLEVPLAENDYGHDIEVAGLPTAVTANLSWTSASPLVGPLEFNLWRINGESWENVASVSGESPLSLESTALVLEEGDGLRLTVWPAAKVAGINVDLVEQPFEVNGTITYDPATA